jgi:hypothetical protein
VPQFLPFHSGCSVEKQNHFHYHWREALGTNQFLISLLCSIADNEMSVVVTPLLYWILGKSQVEPSLILNLMISFCRAHIFQHPVINDYSFIIIIYTQTQSLSFIEANGCIFITVENIQFANIPEFRLQHKYP